MGFVAERVPIGPRRSNSSKLLRPYQNLYVEVEGLLSVRPMTATGRPILVRNPPQPSFSEVLHFLFSYTVDSAERIDQTKAGLCPVLLKKLDPNSDLLRLNHVMRCWCATKKGMTVLGGNMVLGRNSQIFCDFASILAQSRVP